MSTVTCQVLSGNTTFVIALNLFFVRFDSLKRDKVQFCSYSRFQTKITAKMAFQSLTTTPGSSSSKPDDLGHLGGTYLHTYFSYASTHELKQCWLELRKRPRGTPLPRFIVHVEIVLCRLRKLDCCDIVMNEEWRRAKGKAEAQPSEVDIIKYRAPFNGSMISGWLIWIPATTTYTSSYNNTPVENNNIRVHLFASQCNRSSQCSLTSFVSSTAPV